jgi:hypothetical protein
MLGSFLTASLRRAGAGGMPWVDGEAETKSMPASNYGPHLAVLRSCQSKTARA